MDTMYFDLKLIEFYLGFNLAFSMHSIDSQRWLNIMRSVIAQTEKSGQIE